MMKINNLILASSGYIPIRAKTQTDDCIGIEILKIDTTENTVLCQFDKQVGSRNVVIETIMSGEILLQQFEVITPPEGLLQSLKFVSEESQESAKIVSINSDISLLLPSHYTSKSKDGSEDGLPISCNAIALSNERLYVKCEAGKLDVNSMGSGLINLSRNGVIFESLSTKSCNPYTDSVVEIHLGDDCKPSFELISYDKKELDDLLDTTVHGMVRRKELIL